MENNTPPSKLDETIKENLSNYDAKYDSGDWSRMERMLNSAPKESVTKGSYNMAIIIGAVVLVGGFLIYKGVSSSKSTIETPETTVIPIENKTETITKPVPAPVVAKTITTITPTVKEQPRVVPEVKNMITNSKEKEYDKKSTSLDSETLKTQKVSVMGKEPVFGDMIDSSKGIIHETKEKESTKKAAVSKGSNSIGLSGLLNLNADSIRKQKEQLQKDTLHK